jgi:protein dithiol oxidoreductase (disulfide-forming)
LPGHPCFSDSAINLEEMTDMHKAILTPLLGLLATGLLAMGPAWAFDQGIDYKAVPEPQPTETPGKVEVLEMFWYGCPHCFHLEPALAKWLTHKPDYVAFRRVPAVLGPSWALLAKAYYAAEVLGVADRTHAALFAALHKERLHLFDEISVAEWFARQGVGVDKEQFLKALHSFVVDLKVRQAAQLDQRFGIDGVPTFVVNGKYSTSPSMVGSNEKVFQVIDYLAAQEEAAATSHGQGGAAVQGAPQQ